MSRLFVLQSLWGMEQVLINQQRHRSHEENFRLIHEAGFDGISAHFYSATEVAGWIDLAGEREFVIEGCAFPETVEDLRPALELAARYGVHHIAIQGHYRDESSARLAERIAGWQALAREYQVPICLETHRNTLSNDLWVMSDLLDRVDGLPVLADISHYVCGQEIHIPPIGRNAEMIDKVLRHAEAFHGRVSTSEQIQVEISAAIYQPWVQQFMAWWQAGLGYWLDRHSDGGSLTFTCELGPQPYAIAHLDGSDRSCRWAEAQWMRQQVMSLWEALLAARQR